jgi:biopolymer transport protein TolR
MKKPNQRNAKLFGGFGIFPFSLVMLLVFIPCFVALHSEMLCKGCGPDLPTLRTAIELPNAQREDAINVGVQRDGAIYFGNEKIVPTELSGRIATAIAHGSERRVYVRAEGRAPYGAVKLVLRQVGSAGIQNVSFMSEQP